MMWKIILVFGLALSPVQAVPAVLSNPSVLQEEVPPYAKWGRLAMKEIMEKYPDASIIDYLHVGRDTKGEVATETFKLWLHTREKEFGVYVMIEFKTETEELMKIEFQETDR